MDLNMIRSIETTALFILFLGLVFLLYRKTDKKTYEDVSDSLFIGDETSNVIEYNQNKGKDHE